MSISLQPHGLQHARPPCPSPNPRTCSNSWPLNWWCHPIISSSVVPFSSHLQSFQASGSFLVSEFYTSGGQRIGVSTSTSVLPMNIQDWFPLGLTGWISLQSKGLSRVFSSNQSLKTSILQCSVFFMVQLLHPYMTTGKYIALTRWTFVVLEGKCQFLVDNFNSGLCWPFFSLCRDVSLTSPSSVFWPPNFLIPFCCLGASASLQEEASNCLSLELCWGTALGSLWM